MMLFLVGVHIFGFIAVALLMIPALRDDNSDAGEDSGSSDDGWGNRPNVKPDPSRWPGGGIPLPDAEQSSVRLRGPGRLADKRLDAGRFTTRAAQPVRATTAPAQARLTGETTLRQRRSTPGSARGTPLGAPSAPLSRGRDGLSAP